MKAVKQLIHKSRNPGAELNSSLLHHFTIRIYSSDWEFERRARNTMTSDMMGIFLPYRIRNLTGTKIHGKEGYELV